MVTPYFTQHRPPAFVAMLPPIEQISYELGSGGYQRPSAAAARLTSTLSAPGSTTATRLSVSISTARIRSVDSTMPPSTASAPPDRPEPAPRGTTGMPCALAQRMVTCTCSAVSARTAASGVPAVASWVQSKRYFSRASGAVTTTPSGSIPTSSATTASMRPTLPELGAQVAAPATTWHPTPRWPRSWVLKRLPQRPPGHPTRACGELRGTGRPIGADFRPWDGRGTRSPSARAGCSRRGRCAS